MNTPLAPFLGLSDRARGVTLVLTAGVFWSFAGLAVRLIEDANEWQILFFRSVSLIAFLSLYFIVIRRRKTIQVFKECGWAGFFAGLALGTAFCAWIHALTHTTVANALFLLSTSPFFAALLGWWILGEKVSVALFWFIALAIFGVAIMVMEGYQLGTLFGTIMGVTAAIGFGLFAVLLRKGRSSDLVPAVFWAGFWAIVISGTVIFFSSARFEITENDMLYCALMGVFQVGLGLIIFTRGARYLPAAEITLLSLTEIVLGPLWVWLVVGEVPGLLTVIGGFVVLSSIAGQAFYTIRGPS
ncbi:MAG: DMT family transporter [Gammaproteobacteria bacterium]|nr:DMT family transporter [Gammaproteobacteria bacterium]